MTVPDSEAARVWVASKRESVFHLAGQHSRATVWSAPGACGHWVRAVAYRRCGETPTESGGYRVCLNCLIAAGAECAPNAGPRVRLGQALLNRMGTGSEEPTALLPSLRRGVAMLERADCGPHPDLADFAGEVARPVAA